LDKRVIDKKRKGVCDDTPFSITRGLDLIKKTNHVVKSFVTFIVIRGHWTRMWWYFVFQGMILWKPS